MRDWTISSSMLMDYIKLCNDRMNTDSLFHIPLRGWIIYTMLLHNEHFKGPNQLGKLLIQLHSDDCDGWDVAIIQNATSVFFDFDSCQHKWHRSLVHLCQWHNWMCIHKDNEADKVNLSICSAHNPLCPYSISIMIISSMTIWNTIELHIGELSMD